MKESETMVRCSTCKFCYKHIFKIENSDKENDGTIYTCRLYPPTPKFKDDGKDDSDFPKVEEDLWCGQWQRDLPNNQVQKETVFDISVCNDSECFSIDKDDFGNLESISITEEALKQVKKQ
jgi:hypothetical protein